MPHSPEHLRIGSSESRNDTDDVKHPFAEHYPNAELDERGENVTFKNVTVLGSAKGTDKDGMSSHLDVEIDSPSTQGGRARVTLPFPHRTDNSPLAGGVHDFTSTRGFDGRSGKLAWSGLRAGKPSKD